MRGWTAACAACAFYGLWTFATWLLEGRIETLLHPGSGGDRIAYAIVANQLIGTVGAVIALRFLIRELDGNRSIAGFGQNVPSPLHFALAFALGLTLFAVQGAPTFAPVVLVNLFAQVLVVSTAEVLVCWSVVGTVTGTLLQPFGRAATWIGSALVSSILFGIYHLAHSAPFNTLGMIALLTVVALVTSGFFLATRDIYATILFHNFFALRGVARSLEASGGLSSHATPHVPLLLMALMTIVILALSDRTLLRHLPPTGNARQGARSGC